MSKLLVAIIMGSDSDWGIVEEAVLVFKHFGVKVEVRVLSAHRTPEALREYIRDAGLRGCQIFIAAAGMAAHLAGAIAAMTIKPVIGIPLPVGGLGGLDALLATVQMPPGVPVATVAIGSAGAKNAAYLALQMMALSDEALGARLVSDRQALAEKVLDADKHVRDQLS